MHREYWRADPFKDEEIVARRIGAGIAVVVASRNPQADDLHSGFYIWQICMEQALRCAASERRAAEGKNARLKLLAKRPLAIEVMEEIAKNYARWPVDASVANTRFRPTQGPELMDVLCFRPPLRVPPRRTFWQPLFGTPRRRQPSQRRFPTCIARGGHRPNFVGRTKDLPYGT